MRGPNCNAELVHIEASPKWCAHFQCPACYQSFFWHAGGLERGRLLNPNSGLRVVQQRIRTKGAA